MKLVEIIPLRVLLRINFRAKTDQQQEAVDFIDYFFKAQGYSRSAGWNRALCQIWTTVAKQYS
jgi:hypothetical protein